MVRPTKCTPELVAKASEYLDVWESLEHAFPSDIGLLDYLSSNGLGIVSSTLYEWKKDKDHPLSEILATINAKQQLVAWNKGLKNEYNANLVKLLLGKHGFSEKRENEQIGEINHDHKYTIEVVKAK